MKHIIVTSALALALFGGIASAQAQAEKKEKKKVELTEEQKALRKELVGKYDKNADKRIDAEEMKAMSAEDKEKAKKAGMGGGGKKKAK